MNCAEAREGLSAALDGALGAEELRAVEEHAAACAECRRAREELADVRRLLRGVDDADDVSGRTAEIGKGVLAAIAHPSPTEATLERRRVVRAEVLRTGVGGLVLAIVIGLPLLLIAGVIAVAIMMYSVNRAPRQPLDDPPPVSGSRPGSPERRVHGRLELRAGDASTRDAARALFARWPGTFRAEEHETGEEYALEVEFEGRASDGPAFEKELSAFQRAHSGSLRGWSYSQETR